MAQTAFQRGDLVCYTPHDITDNGPEVITIYSHMYMVVDGPFFTTKARFIDNLGVFYYVISPLDPAWMGEGEQPRNRQKRLAQPLAAPADRIWRPKYHIGDEYDYTTLDYGERRTVSAIGRDPVRGVLYFLETPSMAADELWETWEESQLQDDRMGCKCRNNDEAGRILRMG
ncbi:MAG: hypothetical protein Q9227_007768 [Pyrenula ochraceoflavens]